ncbi:putative ribonuclease H-like domain-containing protein [Tanacetum coccineum]
MQKNLLKQQFETFTIGSREELDSAYERFQHILSMLELHDATVSIEDANLKFLRSLPLHVVACVLPMNAGQPGLDELDFDDLYNNLKVYEHELKGVSNSNSQNIAFLSTEVKGSTLKQSTAEPTKGYTQAASSKLVGNRQQMKILIWTQGILDARTSDICYDALTGVEQGDWSMEFDGKHVHFGQDDSRYHRSTFHEVLMEGYPRMDIEEPKSSSYYHHLGLPILPQDFLKTTKTQEIVENRSWGNPERISRTMQSIDSVFAEHNVIFTIKNVLACLHRSSFVDEDWLRHKVKTIRCDHGTEFKNQLMNEFCAKKGIKREYSIARTPQQNGVAERKNRTLIEAARTMLADSLLPIQFWAEAVNTACYVLNRVLPICTRVRQEEGEDYKDEYVRKPVARIEAIRFFFAFIVHGLYCLSDGFPKKAFLYGSTSQKKCMSNKQPPVLKIPASYKQGLQEFVKEALYGLASSPKSMKRYPFGTKVYVDISPFGSTKYLAMGERISDRSSQRKSNEPASTTPLKLINPLGKDEEGEDDFKSLQSFFDSDYAGTETMEQKIKLHQEDDQYLAKLSFLAMQRNKQCAICLLTEAEYEQLQVVVPVILWIKSTTP